jgi:hypothetical protein
LPLNVKYVSSEILWVEWAKKKTYYSNKASKAFSIWASLIVPSSCFSTSSW